VLVSGRSSQILPFQVNAFQTSSVTLCQLAAGTVNEDSAHRLGGGGKEVRAIFKSRIFGANKPKPCFMDEGSGLKSLPGRFTSHFAGGESTQFIVEEVKKLIGGLGVALLHRS